MQKTTTTKIAVNGVRLHVEEQGEGPALILIPGWAYTTEVFQHNVPALSRHYRVIAYDPRSHGRSQVTEDGNNYLQHGKDLHALITALELDEVILVGWSLGVYDALAYMREFGVGRVRALVAIDESPKIIKDRPEDWGEGLAEEIDGLFGAVTDEGYLPFFRDYMAEGFIGEAPEELLDRFTQYASVLSASQAVSLLRDAAEHDFRELCGSIDAKLPVLQVLREDWAEAAVKWIGTNQPNAETLVLGGHLMLMEFAGELNKRILEFLQKRT